MSETPKPAPAPTPAPAPQPPVAPAAPPRPLTPASLTPADEKKAKRIAREAELAKALVAKLGDAVKGTSAFRDQQVVTVDLPHAKRALQAAKGELGFDVLTDVTALDYLKDEGAHPERFCVVWNLAASKDDARLRVRAYVSEDDPRVETVSDLWPAASWGERETFDMFGIRFDGHQGLKRILMPDDFGGHPLRKDYPLRGRGERDNFPVLRRGQSEVDA